MEVSASFLFLCDTIPTSMRVFPSGFLVTTSHFLVLGLLATQYSVAAKAGRLHRDSIARATTLRRNMVVVLGSLALSGGLRPTLTCSALRGLGRDFTVLKGFNLVGSLAGDPHELGC